MIVIQEKRGNTNSYPVPHKEIDYLLIEWFETNKRILHKVSSGGKELTLKFLNASPAFAEGDVLYEDESSVIVVAIPTCDCIIITPKDNIELAGACYEIGNRHLPLFYSNDELLVAFEWPLFRWLEVSGFIVARSDRKLMQALKSTVSGEVHLSAEFDISQKNL